MENFKFSLARYIAGLHRVNLNVIICMAHEYACELNTLEGGKINLYGKKRNEAIAFIMMETQEKDMHHSHQ